MSKITCNVFRSLLGRYFECDALYRLFQSCIGKATSWPCIILLSNRLVVSGYLAVSCCSVKWKVVSVTLSLYLSQIVLQWNLRDILCILLTDRFSNMSYRKLYDTTSFQHKLQPGCESDMSYF